MKMLTLGGHAACVVLIPCVAACLVACGGRVDFPGPKVSATSPQTFTVGGTVSGLAAGAQVVLNVSGAGSQGGVGSTTGTLTIDANGGYTFDVPMVANGSYSVTIAGQPAGQTCSVSNYSGSGINADVVGVNVTCSTLSYTVAGSVSGLAAGAQLTLANNGADPLIVNADGTFTFATQVPYNGSFAVTTASQPSGQTCTVSNPSGSGMTANVSNVNVVCSTDTFTIAGKLSGLALGAQLTLNNNAADPLTLNADGTFTFATPVAHNGSYAVTVGTQPVGQTCSVSGGAGLSVTANVSGIGLTCSTNTFAISGTVAGMKVGTQVTLNNNGADPVTVAADGSFHFNTPVAFNSAYAVTLGTLPTGQQCNILHDSAAAVTADVANLTVKCWVPPLYAYVWNYGDSSFSQYTIGSDGALTPMSPAFVRGRFLTESAGVCGVFEQSLYVVGMTDEGDYMSLKFPIASNGALGTPFEIPETFPACALGSSFYGDAPTGKVGYLDLTGHYLYSMVDSDVWQFTVQADGTLKPMSPPTVATGSNPNPQIVIVRALSP